MTMSLLTTSLLLALSLLCSGYCLVLADDVDDDYPNCTDDRHALPKQHLYNVIVTERNAVDNPTHPGASLISKINGTSDFQFNFAAAWFPTVEGNQDKDGLIVRVVDWKKHPEWANAGALASVSASLPGNNQPLTTARVTQNRIVWPGVPPPLPHQQQVWGAVDPRITYRPSNKLYYLTWDNCTKNCWPHRITYLSTTSDPLHNPNTSWTFHGPVFPFKYSSGAALLFRDNDDNDNPIAGGRHLAFVGDSNTAHSILIAESSDNDGIQSWKIPHDKSRRVLMTGRPGCWDAAGVVVGPQPELLPNGDYLLIYNIDTGWPYHPNPLGRCAIGWAILNGTDPTQIVARARVPLLTASLPWETCNSSSSSSTTATKSTEHNIHSNPNCQVPMVVFATGLKPLSSEQTKTTTNTSGEQVESFYLIYGAADAVVGVAKIQVTIRNNGIVVHEDSRTAQEA